MRVTVDNYLTIHEPTREMSEWCRENLVLPNPDFYKKERMGKWTGNTPKDIWLFERFGDDLVLPFGCWRKINEAFPGMAWDNRILRFTPHCMRSGINLYPYQEKAVNEAVARRNGILVMPTGSGKTQCGLEIVARLGGRALWLTHTQDLLNQSKNRAESVLEYEPGMFGTITAGKVNIGTHITFATVQTMAKLNLPDFKDAFDVVIVDECMPGNTLIDTISGRKELRYLRSGDIITSYNAKTKTIENKQITHVFKNKAHDIVKVKLSNGEEIICTKNHPIFTRNEQWIEAERLVHDDYVLRLVWERGGNECDAKNNKKQNAKKGLLLLFEGMLTKRRTQERCVDGGTQGDSVQNNEGNKYKKQGQDFGEDEVKKSDEKSGDKKNCFGKTEGNRTSSKDKVRKRSGADCSTANIDACPCTNNRSLRRISDPNKNGKRFRLSDLLQGGYCNPGKNDRDRNRRLFSLFSRKTEAGSEKRAVFEWVRVESVTVQEQTSDGTFGGLCEDGYVYNIEVADNNNYFANGILVHNCHHAAGSPTKVTQFYKVISGLSAMYKYGLTATPKRADGLEKSMFAILGDVICKISREDVKHTTCPVKVIPEQTGWMPEFDAVLLGDGTLDYNKLIDNMIHSQERYEVVFSQIRRFIHPCMVLANRVEYLQRLCDDYNTYCGKAVCLSGMGQSKKAKAERKAALEQLNAGEIDCVFATYSLAKEGLDVPNLMYVVFATPEQDETTVIQSVGRVARKADGKDFGTVIDFVDDFGMYKGWYKKRLGYYKKIDAEVEEE